MAAVIAIDAMGGDAAPGPEVAGAVDAVRSHGSRVVLLGNEAVLRPELDRLGGNPSKYSNSALFRGDHHARSPRASGAV